MKWGNSKAFASLQWILCVSALRKRRMHLRKSKRHNGICDGVHFTMQVEIFLLKKDKKYRKWIISLQKKNVGRRGECSSFVSQEKRKPPLCGFWPSSITQWWALREPVCGLKALFSFLIVCVIVWGHSHVSSDECVFRLNNNAELCGRWNKNQTTALVTLWIKLAGFGNIIWKLWKN